MKQRTLLFALAKSKYWDLMCRRLKSFDLLIKTNVIGMIHNFYKLQFTAWTSHQMIIFLANSYWSLFHRSILEAFFRNSSRILMGAIVMSLEPGNWPEMLLDVKSIRPMYRNLSRYSVNENIYKMRTVSLNTIICCFHWIRLPFFQTLLTALNGNAAPHPKKIARLFGESLVNLMAQPYMATVRDQYQSQINKYMTGF